MAFKGLNRNIIKIIALISMTIDHIGYMLFPEIEVLRILGRLAYPIFAYMIAEGCTYTKHKLRYFLLCFVIGIGCSLVYYFNDKSIYLCILLTFSLSIAIIYSIQLLMKKIEGQAKPYIIYGCLLLTLALVGLAYFLGYPPSSFAKYNFQIDYGFFGILTPVIIYLMPNKQLRIFALALGTFGLVIDFGGIQWYAFLAIIPLVLYNGQKGRFNLKYLFYIYYPLHLVAIYGIGLLI